jgi:hypothetical protein
VARLPDTPDAAIATRDQSRQIGFLWPIASRGRVLRLTFVAANTKRDVAHGMSVIPDGFFVVSCDASVIQTPGVLWTPTTAYLQTNAANAHVVGFFYKLREDPIDA